MPFLLVLFRSDRKSTRLNSSHTIISYAVFCLKKLVKQLRALDRREGQPRPTRPAPASARPPGASPSFGGRCAFLDLHAAEVVFFFNGFAADLPFYLHQPRDP